MRFDSLLFHQNNAYVTFSFKGILGEKKINLSAVKDIRIEDDAEPRFQTHIGMMGLPSHVYLHSFKSLLNIKTYVVSNNSRAVEDTLFNGLGVHDIYIRGLVIKVDTTLYSSKIERVDGSNKVISYITRLNDGVLVQTQTYYDRAGYLCQDFIIASINRIENFVYA
jgi:hypothetical protein